MRRILIATASACLFAYPTLAAETAVELPAANSTAAQTAAPSIEAEIAAARIELRLEADGVESVRRMVVTK